MRCYHCQSGHAMKLQTIEAKGISLDLHGLCVGCMGKLEAATYRLKDAIRRQAADGTGEEAGSFKDYIAKELGFSQEVEDLT